MTWDTVFNPPWTAQILVLFGKYHREAAYPRPSLYYMNMDNHNFLLRSSGFQPIGSDGFERLVCTCGF